MENMANNIFLQVLSIPANATGSVSSDPFDTEGYQGVMAFVIYGDSADTLSGSVKWTCKIQSSATENGSYTDVDDDDVLGSATNSFGLFDLAGENTEIFGLSYNGSDRWIKNICTATGAHTNGTPLTLGIAAKMPRASSESQAVNP